jgi:mannosyltransferase
MQPTQNNPENTKYGQFDYVWLIGILALALLLRLINLDSPLWYDEIVTVDTHLRLPWGDVMKVYSLNYHYLFNLQSKLAIVAFGEQNWAIRLPAVVFGVAAVGAMWWLARDIAGSVFAHLTAFLLAISYHHIWFSQNARGYTELAFFSTLGMLLFLRGMERPSRAIWLAYGVTLALAIFTHLTGAFVFAAQGFVWLAVVAWNAARGKAVAGQFSLPLMGYLVGTVLTLLLYAPILPDLLRTVSEVSGTSAVDVMQEYQNPLWSLLEGVRTAIGSTGALVGLVAVAILALSFLGGIAAHRKSALYGPTVAMHIVLTLILLLALGMRIWPRFFFADIGFLMLLILLGVQMVCGWLGRLTGQSAKSLFVAASLAMIVISAALAVRNYTAPKQDLIGAVQYVKEIRKPGERIFAVGYPSAIFNGYLQAGWGTILTNEDYLAQSAAPGPMLFVVAFPARTLRKVSYLDADTETKMELLRRFPGTLGDGAVLIFRRK